MPGSEYHDDLDLASLEPGQIVVLWLSNGIIRRYSPDLRIFTEHGAGRALTRADRSFTGAVRLDEATWAETIPGRERVRVIGIAARPLKEDAPDGTEEWDLATTAMLLQGRWRIEFADGTWLRTSPHGPHLAAVERSVADAEGGMGEMQLGYAVFHAPAARDIGLDMTIAQLQPHGSERIITAPVTRLTRLHETPTGRGEREPRADRA